MKINAIVIKHLRTTNHESQPRNKITFIGFSNMPKGGSSMMEKKANAAKRMMKKVHKKRKRSNGADEGDSDSDDYKDLAYMPTPAQQLAIDQGGNSASLKRKKKKKVPRDENSQVSFTKLKAPTFTSLSILKKHFWLGTSDRGPVGEDLKLQRKSISVLVKGENVERYMNGKILALSMTIHIYTEI